MGNIKDKLKRASLPEATVPVCLNGKLAADFEQLARELSSARQSATDSLDGNESAREIAERMEALRAQMAEDTEEFRLRALPRARWRELVEAHPPRRDEDGRVDKRDAAVGVNLDGLFPDLIRASVISPGLDADDWRTLLGDDETDGVLTDQQFDSLADAAWNLNRRGVDIPFSLAASRILSSGRE